MDYATYLRLPQILSAQSPESERLGRPAHDEMLFIVTHQAYELWFKQVLHELGLVARIFGDERVDDGELGRAVNAAERVVRILDLLVGQIDVLETMSPMDFLEFRDLLFPASGFQSEQFRLIEARLGLDRAKRLSVGGRTFDEALDDAAKARVAGAEAEPTILALVDAWLARTPFVEVARRDGGPYDFSDAYAAALDRRLSADIAVIAANPRLGETARAAQIGALERSRELLGALLDDAAFAPVASEFSMSRRALEGALFAFLYRDEPALHLPYRMLRALMDVDERLALWRLRHALMANRMIGRKVGTGGSSGYAYLKATADEHRIFADLFALATYMIPRSDLPPLPDDVRRSMRFRYEG